MSKYILELKDDVQMVQKVGVAKNGNAFVMNFYKDQLEELTADYINEHYGSLQDDAYQRGLDDAWEAARKIGHASQMKLKEMEFDFTDKDWCYNPSWYVVMNYTSSEAIAKLKAYEEKQKTDEIKVGDEVKTIYNDILGTVTNVNEFEVCVLWRDGSVGMWRVDELIKTNRHFDIASILKEMRT